MESNYEQLVEALRCKALSKQCDSCKYGYHLCPDSECNDACNVERIIDDAADAIEELKDMPWVESVQVDKLRQRIDELEETACHCNVRENAELIAKILDDDVDGKVYQMPKRGEWKRDEKRWGENSIRCSLCGAVIEDEEWGWRNWNYCYHCGAKMEVQDGKRCD